MLLGVAADRVLRPTPRQRWVALAVGALALGLSWPLEGWLAAVPLLAALLAGWLAQPSTRPVESVGGYELLHRVGEGATASVWLGQRRGARERVALKVLHPHLRRDEGLVRRFRREARMLARVRHPQVVRVLDHGEERGRPFVVLEHLAGATLAEQPPVSPEQTLDYAIALLRALRALHRTDLLHRDLKPENVLLRPGVHPRDQPVVTDLGSGRDLRAQATTGLLAGTPAYMSPERRAGALATAQDDLFAWARVVSGWPGADRGALAAWLPLCLGPQQGRPAAVSQVLAALVREAPDPGDPAERAARLQAVGACLDAAEAWALALEQTDGAGARRGLTLCRLRVGPFSQVPLDGPATDLAREARDRTARPATGLPWRWLAPEGTSTWDVVTPGAGAVVARGCAALARREAGGLLAAAEDLGRLARYSGDLYLLAASDLWEALACTWVGSDTSAAGAALDAAAAAEDVGAAQLAAEACGLAARALLTEGRLPAARDTARRALLATKRVHQQLPEPAKEPYLAASADLFELAEGLRPPGGVPAGLPE